MSVPAAEVPRLAKAFKALSHPNRLQMFMNLWHQSHLDLSRGHTHQCFLVTLLDNLRIGAPTVSHHIKELESAGLITTERQGKQLSVAINPDMLKQMRVLFEKG